jgi:threonine aldolase
MVFAGLPRSAHQKAFAAGANYYFWPFNQSLEGPAHETLSARMVASWSTTEQDVQTFLDTQN